MLMANLSLEFQPTPPTRTETWKKQKFTIYHLNFNPLRPRGRRRRYRFILQKKYYFNPLRPRGRRPQKSQLLTIFITFQPTPPTRTETANWLQKRLLAEISTHSAHEDGDLANHEPFFPTLISTHSAHEDGDIIQRGHGTGLSYFNPLRPRGRRPISPSLR